MGTLLDWNTIKEIESLETPYQPSVGSLDTEKVKLDVELENLILSDQFKKVSSFNMNKMEKNLSSFPSLDTYFKNKGLI